MQIPFKSYLISDKAQLDLVKKKILFEFFKFSKLFMFPFMDFICQFQLAFWQTMNI